MSGAAPAATPAYERNEFITAPLRFAGVFSAGECARIMELGLAKPMYRGGIVQPREDYRRTSVTWLDRTDDLDWLFAKLDDLVLRINDWYRFDIIPAANDLQFAEYEAGDTIGWHIDCGGERGPPRKISMSIQLTHPREYDGGALEFVTMGELPMSRIQGTVVAFPSFLCHRVAPVTRGKRHSLVVWVAGQAFR